RKRRDVYIQLGGEGSRRGHLRGGHGKHRGGRGVCAPRPGQDGPRGNRTAALRGNHDIFSAPHVESRKGAESRNRRTWRAWTYGREIRQGFWRTRGAVHHVSQQDRRRETPRRGRSGDFEK